MISMKRTSLGTSFLFSSALFISACSGGGFKTSGDATSGSESTVCTTTKSYSPSVTVTGLAKFYYRPVASIGGGSYGLSGNPILDTIAAAEVVVTDSAGSTVQCSSTNEDGTISVSLPQTAGTYTLTVKSRASNGYLKASVLKDTTDNAPYSISTTFSIASGDTAVNAGTLLAYARLTESANLEGGAFNILKNLYNSNKYIRVQTNSSFVAEKVTVYWKAGFNPYSYYGYPSSLLSFYIPGERKLYILGGYDGNVHTSDTDHFDNSVIIHEYGHFLEDVYGKTDSPGGSHNGNLIIDPRLAWSEGWANFIQAAVQGTSVYLDTAGYCSDTTETSGTCTQNVRLDLTQDGATATHDSVTSNGEGIYREVSIARTLYKTIATPINASSPYRAAIPFANIWNIFSNGSVGFKSSSVHFRNMALMTSQLNTVIAASYPSNVTAWTNMITDERQPTTTQYYADTLNAVTAGTCTAKTIAAVADANLGSAKVSNKLKSDAFYQYYYDGVSNTTLSVVYSPGTPNTDLDLYVYKESHTYFEEEQQAQGSSNSTYAVRGVLTYGSTESGTESVSMAGQPAGYYLINVTAVTYQKTNPQLGSPTYTLKETVGSTTRDLCPAN